jgi:hypothetical protein
MRGRGHRDCVGDCCIAGDSRWGGAFGVSVDLVALSHCAVQIIQMEDLLVRCDLLDEFWRF